MSTTLKVATKFQDESLGRGYLKNSQSIATDEKLESYYQQLRAAKFANAVRRETPTITMLFAGSGTGAKTMIKSLMDKTHSGAIVTNPERFISGLPEFSVALQELQEHMGGHGVSMRLVKDADGHQRFADEGPEEDHFRADQERITKRFINIGYWASNRMVEEAINEGYDVIIPTRMRSNGALILQDNITKAGVNLHTIILQADEALKQSRASEAYNHVSGAATTKEDIHKQHVNLTSNMVEIAKRSQSRFDIYLGHQERGLVHVASRGSNGKVRIVDVEGKGFFDGLFVRHTSVNALMRLGNVAPAAQAEPALQPVLA